ncbi:MAG: hypothetical protein NTZ80_04510 [Patescibacteria group bacterium]|nr:hypothetical protein [Patescibacteria group bacterium]
MPTCVKCSNQFDVIEDDLSFCDRISPVFNGKKYQIPFSTLCPACRQQRKMAFRNEHNLYARKCDLTGKKIISIYNDSSKFTVYDQKIWWGDSWNEMDYGMDFDFNRSFFDQFFELTLKTPKPSLLSGGSENSEYINLANNNKNCYLIFKAGFNENVYYSYWIDYIKDSIDIAFCNRCEFCYDLYYCDDCYDMQFSQNLKNCQNGKFLYDCRNCHRCLMCSGLRNKSHCFLNKQYSKGEYEATQADFEKDILSAVRKYRPQFEELKLSTPRRFTEIFQSEDCFGDYISKSKNCSGCYTIEGCENCFFCDEMKFSKNCRYCSCFGLPGEFLYEVNNIGINSTNVSFCSFAYTLADSMYSDHCFYSSNLFGCSSMKYKQYCILNKQYSKQEYEELVPKIIEHMQKSTPLSPPYSRGEASEASRGVEWPASRSFSEGWGEFFHPSLSPFGYNETVAQEYFPLTKKQAQEQGFNWSDYEAPFPKVEKIIKADELNRDQKFLIPENNDILNYAIECEITKKPFRIIKQELDFYRKHNLPLPRRHPDQRHKDRLSLRNPRKLWSRICNKCNIPIQTSYSPDRPETVYCEKCYLETVYLLSRTGQKFLAQRCNTKTRRNTKTHAMRLY